MNIKNIGSNQTEVATDSGIKILVSYETAVAAQLKDGSYIRTEQKYSATTSRHINNWVGDNAKLVSQSKLDSLF